MFAFIMTLSSLLVCRFRSRVALEPEVVALPHQLAVLRRQQPGRPKLTSLDRLLWLWLYRIWPRWERRFAGKDRDRRLADNFDYGRQFNRVVPMEAE
jgi:hypothetical protein